MPKKTNDPKHDEITIEQTFDQDLATQYEKNIQWLEKKLEEAELITKRAQSDYLRLKMDMDALHARSWQQQQQAKSESIQKVAKAILPFVSQLKQSIDATPEDIADNSRVGWITLMYWKALQSLEQVWISAIHPEQWSPVDLTLHAPISSQESSEYDTWTILQVVQQWYVFKDSDNLVVLMPAQIVVVA